MNGANELKKMVERRAAELEGKRCAQELLSGYKKILLEGIDKLEKKRATSLIPDSLDKVEIYRVALNDVRFLIK